MRILLAIVHFWDPEGGGRHQSLRPNPAPRIAALQAQLLSIRRLGIHRSYLHMADRNVYRADQSIRHEIDIRIITDGKHHVLDLLDESYKGLFEEVITSPSSGRKLGFEAHKFLSEQLDKEYDLYGYFEDDLVIHDPLFFQKISWFEKLMGLESILLPQRFEFAPKPNVVDRFYIDGPMVEEENPLYQEKKGPLVVKVPYLSGDIEFELAKNPHGGCFFLSSEQLQLWIDQPYWLDFDCSFISELESSATLGILKTFKIYKTCFSNAAWLELQHWGTNFHMLIKPDTDE